MEIKNRALAVREVVYKMEEKTWMAVSERSI